MREYIQHKHALIDPTKHGYTVGATTRLDWSKVPDTAAYKGEAGRAFVPAFTMMAAGEAGVYPLEAGTDAQVSISAGVATLDVAVEGAYVGGRLLLLAEDGTRYDPAGYVVTDVSGNTQLATPEQPDGTASVTVLPPVVGMMQHSLHQGDPRNNHDNIALYSGGGFYENLLPQAGLASFETLKRAFAAGATWLRWATYVNSLEGEALSADGGW